ncbi:MAG: hypothetical protein IJJ69_08515 [Oscillospiraceae bacterium]|nr:hypothetical protein [Oscillospiraceae bacterium]
MNQYPESGEWFNSVSAVVNHDGDFSRMMICRLKRRRIFLHRTVVPTEIQAFQQSHLAEVFRNPVAFASQKYT